MLRFLAPVVTLFVAACASITSPPVGGDHRIRIVSWNLEHLAEANGSGCRPRTEAEYEALRAFASRIDADVIAFQEVESEAAAQRLFDPGRYTIVMETRAGSQSHPPCRGQQGLYLNRQAVGFAIRRGLEIERHADLTELQLGDPDLRSGVDIEVGVVGGPRLRLLALHLKSGCAAGATNDACLLLFRQTPLVERWIDARAAAGERFAVLGDFNRRLATPGDQVWQDLDDGDPTELALTSGGARATCDPRYSAFIDHIVIPAANYQLGNFQEWTFDGERLSDHCPISTEIRLTRAD